MNLPNKNAAFLSLAVGLAVAGCTTTGSPVAVTQLPEGSQLAANTTYATQPDEKFTVPAIDVAEIDPKNIRQQVNYQTDEPPGTIVIDTKSRFIYLVREGGKAMRYGVGVGREGLEFKGTAKVGFKREWPHWTPTPAMIAREPKRYARWAKGMDGGIGNPLGARALYLFKDGKDTLFRIHGTNEPNTIGHAVSSGCIRMMNQDVIDLYRRVPSGSKVVVR